MNRVKHIFICCLLIASNELYSQHIILEKGNLRAINVAMSIQKPGGKEVVKVTKDSAIESADQPTFVKIKGRTFQNGTIEVNVLSNLLKNAPESSRGFIGIAFRINDSNTKFECIYIRPTNGRAEDQL